MDLSNWKIPKWDASQTKQSRFLVDEGAMDTWDASCQVCGTPVVVYSHNEFAGIAALAARKKAGAKAGRPPEADEKNAAVWELLKMATCTPCFRARKAYVDTRENIGSLFSWLLIHYSFRDRVWKYGTEWQEAQKAAVKERVRRYVAALQMMAKMDQSPWCDDIWRPFWLRPTAWGGLLDELDSTLFTGRGVLVDQAYWEKKTDRISGRKGNAAR